MLLLRRKWTHIIFKKISLQKKRGSQLSVETQKGLILSKANDGGWGGGMKSALRRDQFDIKPS